MYTGLSATLRRCSPLYECDSILRIYLYVWLKCYISGDALHGSGSRIKPIQRFCVVLQVYLKPLSSLQLVPVTRIEQLAKRTGALKSESEKRQMGWPGRFFEARAIAPNI